MYLTGLIGLQWSVTLPFFKLLVPFHLIISTIVLFLYDEASHKSMLFFCLFTFTACIAIEALGVYTGAIFGQYLYGDTLGWKILNVPLVIGANWLLLVYCIGIILNTYSNNAFFKSLIGGALIVLLDVLIEPVAMHLDFWNWHNSEVPFQNYLAWYIISFLLLWLFYNLPFQKKNKLAGLMLGCQFLFFTAHNLLYMIR